MGKLIKGIIFRQHITYWISSHQPVLLSNSISVTWYFKLSDIQNLQILNQCAYFKEDSMLFYSGICGGRDLYRTGLRPPCRYIMIYSFNYSIEMQAVIRISSNINGLSKDVGLFKLYLKVLSGQFTKLL